VGSERVVPAARAYRFRTAAPTLAVAQPQASLPPAQRTRLIQLEHARETQRASAARRPRNHWRGCRSRPGSSASARARSAPVQNRRACSRDNAFNRRADVGIIALSLALAPAFAGTASYTLIPDEFHQPLRQGFVILKRGEGKELAKAFAAFFWTADGRKIMSRYGFSLPGGTAAH